MGKPHAEALRRWSCNLLEGLCCTWDEQKTDKRTQWFYFFFSPLACMNVWKYFVRLFHFASVYNYCLFAWFFSTDEEKEEPNTGKLGSSKCPVVCAAVGLRRLLTGLVVGTCLALHCLFNVDLNKKELLLGWLLEPSVISEWILVSSVYAEELHDLVNICNDFILIFTSYFYFKI